MYDTSSQCEFTDSHWLHVPPARGGVHGAVSVLSDRSTNQRPEQPSEVVNVSRSQIDGNG